MTGHAKCEVGTLGSRLNICKASETNLCGGFKEQDSEGASASGTRREQAGVRSARQAQVPTLNLKSRFISP